MDETTIPPKKRCTKCGEEKPATHEEFGACAARSDGFSTWCRLCHRNNARELRAGRPRHRLSVADRFWAKVNKSGPTQPHMDTPCWEWTAARQRFGYGKFCVTKPFIDGAHRFSWSMHNGPIPDGLWVLHKCDNPPCVNPAHLFLGTSSENQTDMASKGRSTRGAGAVATEDMVRELRRLYDSGVTQKELRARFTGLKRATINAIVRRKCWTHVV